MHCVYHAYKDHINFLNLKTTRLDWEVYRSAKKLTHTDINQMDFNQMTKGSMTPFIIKCLSLVRNLDFKMQHRIWTKDHFIADAETQIQKMIASTTNYGEEVEYISLYPSISLDLFGHHAIFDLRPNLRELHASWTYNITMAIQLNKRRV